MNDEIPKKTEESTELAVKYEEMKRLNIELTRKNEALICRVNVLEAQINRRAPLYK